MSKIDEQVNKETKAQAAEIAERLDELRQIVSDHRRTPEARKEAAKEIVKLTGPTSGVPDAADTVEAEEVADDDPDVLVLTAPRDAETEKLIAALPVFAASLGARSLGEAKVIVRDRRTTLVALQRVVDEGLPDADRLAAVRLILNNISKSVFESLREGSLNRLIGHRTPEWLLTNISDGPRPPSSLHDVWGSAIQGSHVKIKV